jgi:hypothetical protein
MSHDSGKPSPTREALLAEYGEVANNFRTLTDIRFKLLGFLPLASAGPVILAMAKGDLASVAMFMLGLFGLAATVGLALYNSRNDQLYDELIGRAGDLERRLDIVDGNFGSRPRSWLDFELPFIRLKVGHREAVATIYAASVALWLSLIFATLLSLYGAPSAGYATQALALLLAIASVWLGYHVLEGREERRDDELRQHAHDAYRLLIAEQAGTDRTKPPSQDPVFLRHCALLAGGKEKDLPSVDGLDKTEKPTKGGIWEQTKARAAFYDKHPEYLTKEPKEERAAQMVALLTDMPPRWIRDCGHDRRGAIAKAAAKEKAAAAQRSWWPLPREARALLLLSLVLLAVALSSRSSRESPAGSADSPGVQRGPVTTEAVTSVKIEPAESISIPAIMIGLLFVGTGIGLLVFAKGRFGAVASGLSLVTLGSLFSGASLFKEVTLGNVNVKNGLVIEQPPTSGRSPGSVDVTSLLESIGSVSRFRLGSADELERGVEVEDVYRKIAGRWVDSRAKGRDGTLMFVGSTDEVPLSKAGQLRYEGNVGLARARAETVKDRFIKAVKSHTSKPEYVPGPDKMLVLVSGPQQLRDPGKDGRKEGAAEYRRVDIWAFWAAEPPRREPPKL